MICTIIVAVILTLIVRLVKASLIESVTIETRHSQTARCARKTATVVFPQAER